MHIVQRTRPQQEQHKTWTTAVYLIEHLAPWLACFPTERLVSGVSNTTANNVPFGVDRPRQVEPGSGDNATCLSTLPAD